MGVIDFVGALELVKEPDMRELSRESEQRLDAVYDRLTKQREQLIGYQCSAQMDYSALFRFLHLPINNVGDPYAPSTYRLDTKDIECEVLAWFAELTHADSDNYWGYITNGGSEGNLYGLYLARELYPQGMVYYCEETHYSVSKNLRMLRMPSIMIRAQANGEIDYDDLKETIRIHRDVPPILFANIGTTMKEGLDDIPRIRCILHELAIPQWYIHCDAALAGMTLPFIEDSPKWDFRSSIDSLSISGHKFIGSPVPCGIVLANKDHVNRIARSIEYVGTLDTTVTGSRNGITPLFLWYAIHRHGRDGFAERVRECLATADYAIGQFGKLGLTAWRNRHAITVVFHRPPQSVLDKWQIAVKDDHAHVICMPHVTRGQIDTFIADLAEALENASSSPAVRNSRPVPPDTGTSTE